MVGNNYKPYFTEKEWEKFVSFTRKGYLEQHFESLTYFVNGAFIWNNFPSKIDWEKVSKRKQKVK